MHLWDVSVLFGGLYRWNYGGTRNRRTWFAPTWIATDTLPSVSAKQVRVHERVDAGLGDSPFRTDGKGLQVTVLDVPVKGLARDSKGLVEFWNGVVRFKLEGLSIGL